MAPISPLPPVSPPAPAAAGAPAQAASTAGAPADGAGEGPQDFARSLQQATRPAATRPTAAKPLPHPMPPKASPGPAAGKPEATDKPSAASAALPEEGPQADPATADEGAPADVAALLAHLRGHTAPLSDEAPSASTSGAAQAEQTEPGRPAPSEDVLTPGAGRAAAAGRLPLQDATQARAAAAERALVQAGAAAARPAIQAEHAAFAEELAKAQPAAPAAEPSTTSPAAALPLPLAASAAPAPAGTSPASPAEATLAARPGSEAFAPQFSAQISTFVRDGVEHARLHLNPADMGPVTVQIQLEGATAQVHLLAEHGGTRQALEQAMPQLASTLREAGLTLTGGGVFQQPRQAGGEAGGNGRPGSRGTPGEARNSRLEALPSLAQAPALRPRGVVDLIA